MDKKKLMTKDEIRNFTKENNIKDVEGIEDRIISMYANGMSFLDI